jgi:transcription initiation factor TFIIIB Brf1 subunit/transcription initiation factor TFIIB
LEDRLSDYNPKCAECDGDVVLENGEYVCSRCGLVLSYESTTPECQSNSSLIDQLSNVEKTHSSVGTRLHIVDGLGSYIDYHNKGYFYDSQGEPLSSNKQMLFRRLKYHYDMKSRTERRETDYNALRVLNRVSALLRLSENVRNRAAYYYRKVTSSKLSADVSNKLITISTCLFMAVREFKDCAPVTIQELAGIFRSLGHRVSVRSIVRELPKLQSKLGTNVRVRRSEEYLNRIVSSVVSQPEVQSRLKESNIEIEEYRFNTLTTAISILKELSISSRGGRNPFILAVSAVYAADRKLSETRKVKPTLTQRILAKATGAAEYSVRDHFCSLLKSRSGTTTDG